MKRFDCKRDDNNMFDFTLVDSHIHPFLTQEYNICNYPVPESPEEFVEILKRSGVTLCCGSVIKPGAWLSCWEDVEKCNDDCFEFAGMFENFFIPGLLIHAAFPEQSCAEIEKRFSTGKLHWIGEIVPYSTGTMQYSAESLFPVYDLAQERGLPVNIHPGSGVEDICRIAENFPELKIVIAHPGEKPSYMEKLAAMKKFKNIHLDLSGTGIFRWGMLQYGVKEVGAERFLYGSDFPVCSPMTNLAGIKAEKLAAADEKLIISENFRRLTGL